MHDYRLFVTSGVHFDNASQALMHIGERMLAEGMVLPDYPAALLQREHSYPTGIALENHAVAIPHCEAIHALEPAIYLIRPDKAVEFYQADGDGKVAATLIIALVVTHPQQQLTLLRALFSQLQQPEFMEMLLSLPEAEVAACFNRQLLAMVA
ncbi:PTS galactitol transporter subunit IIA [Pseudomonas cerasi]